MTHKRTENHSRTEIKIYLHQKGNEKISYNERGYPSTSTGWSGAPNSERTKVCYYGGEWGWLSLQELSDARQNSPKTAP